jgi:hypothetical protein
MPLWDVAEQGVVELKKKPNRALHVLQSRDPGPHFQYLVGPFGRPLSLATQQILVTRAHGAQL